MKSVFAEHRHHARRVSRLGRLRGGVGVALALEFLVAYGCTVCVGPLWRRGSNPETRRLGALSPFTVKTPPVNPTPSSFVSQGSVSACLRFAFVLGCHSSLWD